MTVSLNLRKLSVNACRFTSTTVCIIYGITHCHVYSSLARIRGTYQLRRTFWSRAVFRNLPLPVKCTDPEENDMRTRSVCGFFLTWVGSYENHCFGINAHTFLFQVGHPSMCLHACTIRVPGEPGSLVPRPFPPPVFDRLQYAKVSLVPRPFPPPVFDRLQYAKVSLVPRLLRSGTRN